MKMKKLFIWKDMHKGTKSTYKEYCPKEYIKSIKSNLSINQNTLDYIKFLHLIIDSCLFCRSMDEYDFHTYLRDFLSKIKK